MEENNFSEIHHPSNEKRYWKCFQMSRQIGGIDTHLINWSEV